jgi:uncharacterized protein
MTQNQIKIPIKVTPNAGKNNVIGLVNGVWKIKIAAPPDKGKANKELVAFLSNVLGIKKDNIEIITGHIGHHKIIGVSGLSQGEIMKKLSQNK